MKVIELLNKIANGEAPKEIKVHNKIYKWKENLNLYICGGGQLWFDYFVENNKLNYKVEIIEDNKIEKLDINDNGLLVESPSVVEIVHKINEIIDKLNERVDLDE